MRKPSVNVGDRFENTIGHWFTIITYFPSGIYDGEFRNAKCLVRFDSGYETFAAINHLKGGYVKDRFRKQIYGIGYLGKDKVKNVRIYNLWRRVLRCYDKKHYYHKYGVTVCKRWHNFSNFQKDVVKLEGYDQNNLKRNGNKGLELDKDIKGNGKLYSPETCVWVTKRENALQRWNGNNYRRVI